MVVEAMVARADRTIMNKRNLPHAIPNHHSNNNLPEVLHLTVTALDQGVPLQAAIALDLGVLRNDQISKATEMVTEAGVPTKIRAPTQVTARLVAATKTIKMRSAPDTANGSIANESVT